MKVTKKSLTYFIVFTLLGIIALLYAIFVVPRSDYREGLIYGVSSGFVLVGIVGIVYSIYLMRNPRKAKEVEVQKNEERAQFIRMKSSTTTLMIMLYAECAGVLISGLMGFMEISITLALVLFIQMLVSLVAGMVYAKKY